MQHHGLLRRKHWCLHFPSSFLGPFSALWAIKAAKLHHKRTCPEGTHWAGGSDICGPLGYQLPFLLTVYLGNHWHGLVCNRVAVLSLQHQLVPLFHLGRNSAIVLYTCFWSVVPSSFNFREFCIAIYTYNAQLITVQIKHTKIRNLLSVLSNQAV